MAEPRGLNFMSRSLTGVKRKDVKRKEYQPKSKRRRKLEYEVIDEDWGLAIGEDMSRIEKEAERRNQFLKAGDMMDKKVGTNIKQSTLKTWSRNELFCREIANSLMKTSSSRAVFMSSLLEHLQEASLTSIISEVTEGQSNRSPTDNPEKEDSRGQDEHPVMKLAITVSKEPPEGWKPQGRKMLRTVKELFQAQDLQKRLKDEEELEKEERLERRKRLERGWKEKRNHYQKIRWASEWLEKVAIEQSVTTGHSLVRGRMTSLVMDLVDEVVEKGTSRASCGLDTNIQA